MSTATTTGAVAPINAAGRAGDINTATDVTAALAEHAAEIRARGRRVIADVIEIGRRLSECRKIVKRGQWVPWLEDNFGWSDDTALRFMKVYALTNEEPFNSRKLREWNLPLSAVYLISEQSTPPEAKTEISARAEAGEVLSVPEVKRVIKASKQPAKKAVAASAAKTAKTSTVAAIAKNGTPIGKTLPTDETEIETVPIATGNDVDAEMSAEARKAAYAADEADPAAIEITKPAPTENVPIKPATATKGMSKGEKKRQARYALLVGCANDTLQDIIDALQLVINALDDNAELVAGQGAQLDQLLAKARELDELVQRGRAKRAPGGGQS